MFCDMTGCDPKNTKNSRIRLRKRDHSDLFTEPCACQPCQREQGGIIVSKAQERQFYSKMQGWCTAVGESAERAADCSNIAGPSPVNVRIFELIRAWTALCTNWSRLSLENEVTEQSLCNPKDRKNVSRRHA